MTRKKITVTCSACNGTGGSTRARDYVRGDRTEFCQSCDGDGTVTVPQLFADAQIARWWPAYLGERRAGLHGEFTDEGLQMRAREQGGKT